VENIIHSSYFTNKSLAQLNGCQHNYVDNVQLLRHNLIECISLYTHHTGRALCFQPYALFLHSEC